MIRGGGELIRLPQKPDKPQQFPAFFGIQLLDAIEHVMYGNIAQILPVQIGIAEITAVRTQKIVGADLKICGKFQNGPKRNIAAAVFVIGVLSAAIRPDIQPLFSVLYPGLPANPG